MLDLVLHTTKRVQWPQILPPSLRKVHLHPIFWRNEGNLSLKFMFIRRYYFTPEAQKGLFLKEVWKTCTPNFKFIYTTLLNLSILSMHFESSLVSEKLQNLLMHMLWNVGFFCGKHFAQKMIVCKILLRIRTYIQYWQCCM